MFKGFQDTSRGEMFRGFPNLNFNQDNSAYGYSGCVFWLDAAFGLNTQTNLAAVSSWVPRIGRSRFIQTTAGNQPRLILNDPNYNNLPSVEAISSDRFMTAANGIRINNGNITIAVISKVTSNSQYNGILSNSGNLGAIGLIDGGTDVTATGFGFIPSLQGTTESLNARVKILTKNNVVVNGSSEVSGAMGVTVELNRLFLLFSGRGHIGTIAEIIAFDYSMTLSDALSLSNRINQKYLIY